MVQVTAPFNWISIGSTLAIVDQDSVIKTSRMFVFRAFGIAEILCFYPKKNRVTADRKVVPGTVFVDKPSHWGPAIHIPSKVELLDETLSRLSLIPEVRMDIRDAVKETISYEGSVDIVTVIAEFIKIRYAIG